MPPIVSNKMLKYNKKQAKRIDTLNAFKLKPAWFATCKNVAVVIDYFTAWAEKGKLQSRPDIYNCDNILGDALKRDID